MGQSTCLALAMASFVGTHLLLSHPLRDPTVRAIGEKAFLGLYSLISFATLGWAIYIAWHSPAQTPLWVAPIWGWHVATIVMLIATILLVGSLIGNPAMVDPTGQPKFPAQARGVYAITRHPMMWSFILWAIVHAALWGSPKTLIFAGGIGGLALIGALGQDIKKAKTIGAAWQDWQARTSFIPFAALLGGKARWRTAIPGAIPLIGGLAIWLVASWLHPLPTGPWLWTG